MMKTVLLLLIMAMSFSSFAEQATTGVQLCGKKVTLYAFYEGAHPLLHNIPVWKENPRLTRSDYLRLAMEHIQKDAPGIVTYIAKNLRTILLSLDVALVTKLPPHETTTDVVFLDADCSYVGAAIWPKDAPYPLIDENLFGSLSPMGQAGLLYQEAMFRFVREAEEAPSNTDFSRQWTATVFSDKNLRPNPYRPDMTEEQRIAASKQRYCTNSLNTLSKAAPLWVKTLKMCAEDKDKAQYYSTRDRVKKLMLETIEECERDCLWDEGVLACREYRNLLDHRRICD